MPYATLSDLVLSAGGSARLVQLADWDNDQTADPDVIARALAAADALIDDYLRLRTSQTDLAWLRANPTPSVREIAADEAIYSIRKWREIVGEHEIKLRDGRIDLLKQINVGKLRLSDSPSPRRAVFIENDDCEISKEKLKGQW